MQEFDLKICHGKPKYIQVYSYIKNLIKEGKLAKNEQILPIRVMSKKLNLNTSTIVKAYSLLENEGYLYKIVGSGTYVSAISEVSKEKDSLFKSKNIVYFDIGTPSSDMFPIEDFKKAISMVLKYEDESMFEYDQGLGYLKLRESLNQYIYKQGIVSNVNRIQIISGAQQGIDIICKSLLSYGDVIFVENPTYVGALDVFRNKGVKIVSIPMLNDGMDLGILKVKLEKLRPRLVYTMPNFQNPTGISMSESKKKIMIELAQEYDFYIIEDDFLSDFKFNSKEHFSLRHYDLYKRVIYIKSFSKILMPGLRVGFMELPENLIQKIALAKQYTDISTTGVLQRALYYYMNNFNWDLYMENLEKIYEKKFKKCLNCIDKYLKNKLEYTLPLGGINFFLALPKGYSAVHFREFMIKNGVSILPAYDFFSNPLEDRFFRLNIACSSEEEIELGIRKISVNLDQFLKKYKNRLDFSPRNRFY